MAPRDYSREGEPRGKKQESRGSPKPTGTYLQSSRNGTVAGCECCEPCQGQVLTKAAEPPLGTLMSSLAVL